MQDLVLEIITKEEERFSLRHIGAVREVDSLAPIISGKVPYDGSETGFYDFRNAVLASFYREIGFEVFIEQQKKTEFETPFFTTLYHNLKRKYNSKAKEPSDWEKDLGLLHAIAWHLTFEMFRTIRNTFSNDSANFNNAAAVWSYFDDECLKILPIGFQEFISQIESGDEYFREALAGIVKKSVENVTKRKNSAFDESLLSSALWEETYTFFIKKLEEGTLKFDLPVQLRAYLTKTCEISFLEYCRGNKKELKNREYIDEIAVLENIGDENDDNCEFDAADVDVDTTNEYEVARAIAVILLNKNHPLYQKIVRKDEEKVKLLMEKSINNLSYAEIADKFYSDCSEREKEKKVISMRKEYERFRAVLKSRYIEIMTKKSRNVPI